MRTVVLALLTLVACAAPTRPTTRVYPFQQPVVGIGGSVLSVKDADWTNCDALADGVAWHEYVNARYQWQVLLGMAAAGTAAGMAGASSPRGQYTYTHMAGYGDELKGEPEAEKDRLRRDDTYEQEIRRCLKRRGYAIEAIPLPSFSDPRP